MSFHVMARMCPTCIYRPACPLSVDVLETAIADEYMEGFFRTYRICHHTPGGVDACCRGFWLLHKDHFTIGQIAQRLGMVEYVSSV